MGQEGLGKRTVELTTEQIVAVPEYWEEGRFLEEHNDGYESESADTSSLTIFLLYALASKQRRHGEDHSRSDAEALAEVRKILESAPLLEPRPAPNREPKPIAPDFFRTSPGFWEEYGGLQR
jgi:hypothetical protein